jgi:hypothetical protein
VIANYYSVAQRIRQECDDLERVVKAVQRHWQSSKTAAEPDAFINSVALNLHGFYSGLERIFEQVAIKVDGVKLDGEHWHSDLLRQITLDLPKIRPPVLSRDIANRLDHYLRFRHVIRNIYTTNIVPSDLEKLVVPLPQFWAEVQSQLLAFAKYLDELAHADEEN